MPTPNHSAAAQKNDQISLQEYAQALDDVQVGVTFGATATIAVRMAKIKIDAVIAELRDTAEKL